MLYHAGRTATYHQANLYHVIDVLELAIILWFFCVNLRVGLQRPRRAEVCKPEQTSGRRIRCKLSKSASWDMTDMTDIKLIIFTVINLQNSFKLKMGLLR